MNHLRKWILRVLSATLMITALAAAQTRQAQRGTHAFHQIVRWSAESNPVPWETSLSASDDGPRYRLSVVPLWAVEGGIVGIEISLTDEKKPGNNLLGERNDEPQPFVITVEELEAGIAKSRFGTTRVFELRSSKLRAHIKGSRLGKGVGNCGACANIQALTIEFTFG